MNWTTFNERDRNKRGEIGVPIRQQFCTNRILNHERCGEETGITMQFTLEDLLVLVLKKINLHCMNASYYFMEETKEDKCELLLTAVHW